MGRKRKRKWTERGSIEISVSESESNGPPRPHKRKTGRERLVKATSSRTPLNTSQALSNFRVEVRKAATGGSVVPRYERFVQLKDENIPSFAVKLSQPGTSEKVDEAPAVNVDGSGSTVDGNVLEVPLTLFSSGSNPECSPCTHVPVKSSRINEEPLILSAYKKKPDPARMRANMSPPKASTSIAELHSAEPSHNSCEGSEVPESCLSAPATSFPLVAFPVSDAGRKNRRKTTSVTWKSPPASFRFENLTDPDLERNQIPISDYEIPGSSQDEKNGDDIVVLESWNEPRVSLDKQVQVGAIPVSSNTGADRTSKCQQTESFQKDTSSNPSYFLENRTDSLARVGSKTLSRQAGKTSCLHGEVGQKRPHDDVSFHHEMVPLPKMQKLHRTEGDQFQGSKANEASFRQVPTRTRSDTRSSGSRRQRGSLSSRSSFTTEDSSHYQYTNFHSPLSAQPRQTHHQSTTGVVGKYRAENPKFSGVKTYAGHSSMGSTSGTIQDSDRPLGRSRSLLAEFSSVSSISRQESIGSSYRSGSSCGPIGNELSLESQETEHSTGPYNARLTGRRGQVQTSWSESSFSSKPGNFMSQSRSPVVGQSSMGPSTDLFQSESSAESSSGVGSYSRKLDPSLSGERRMGEVFGRLGGVSPAKCFRGEALMPGSFGGFGGMPADSNFGDPLISGRDHRYGSSINK